MNSQSDLMCRLARSMLRIRRFEEKIVAVYGVQDMKTPVHLCIGQEAIAAGVCAVLRPDDYMFTTHRGHGHCLAKGQDAFSLYAEFYGRVEGCARGKGGSMHPAAPELGILGTSAIVGGGVPIAVGAALAAKMQRSGRISAVFFGDGAADEGTFHESLNFAALHQLPVLFVCENNFYAVNSNLRYRHPDNGIAHHAANYGIPFETLDGTDVLAVHATAEKFVSEVRAGQGPRFMECTAYRWHGHVGPEYDHEKGCRDKAELDEWRERCPVETFFKKLMAAGALTAAEREQWEHELAAELDDALDRARRSQFPAREEVLAHVYR